MVKKFLQVLGVLIWLVFFTSCGGKFEANKINLEHVGDSKKTGGTKTIKTESGKKIELPYTSAGHQVELQSLKDRMIADEKFDQALTSAIARVNLDRLDEAGNPSDKNVRQIKVEIIFKSQSGDKTRSLSFNNKVVEHEGKKKVFESSDKNSKDSDQIQFWLQGECLTENCKKIELVLSQRSKSALKSDVFKAGFIVVSSEREVELQRPRQQSDNIHPELQKIFDLESKNIVARQNDVMIAMGPSYTSVHIEDPNNRGKDLISIEADRVQTGDHALDLKNVRYYASNGQQIQGKLVGNDPESGGLVLDLDFESVESEKTMQTPRPQQDEPVQTSFRMVVSRSEFQKHDPREDAIQNDLPEDFSSIKGFIPLPTDARKYPQSVAYTTAIRKLATHPKIREYITYWQGKKTFKRCNGEIANLHKMGQNFFYRIASIVPHFMPGFLALDAPPQITYLMPQESKFSYKPNYIIEVNDKSTAGGPLQILKGTAKRLAKNKIFPTEFEVHDFPKEGERRLHDSDHRNFAVPSMLAASVYFNIFAKQYPKNPEFWVLAYKQGEGSLAKYMKCAQLSSKAKQKSCMRHTRNAWKKRKLYFNTSFSQIVRFNIIGCVARQYYLKTLSLTLIGTYPEKYGFELPKENLPEVPREKLYPPNHDKASYADKLIEI